MDTLLFASPTVQVQQKARPSCYVLTVVDVVQPMDHRAALAQLGQLLADGQNNRVLVMGKELIHLPSEEAEWIAHNFAPLLEQLLPVWVAIVLPRNIQMRQVAIKIQQMLEQVPVEGLSLAYFELEADALKWLENAPKGQAPGQKQ